MGQIMDLYKKADNTECNACKLSVYEKIAMYRNMICTTGIGKFKRGYNIYIHPDGKKASDFDIVRWVPNLNHNH